MNDLLCNLVLQFTSVDTEEAVDVVSVFAASRSIHKGTHLATVSGRGGPTLYQQKFVSSNHILLIRFHSDGTLNGRGFNVTWFTGEYTILS